MDHKMRKKIAIVGAGFGGIAVCQRICKSKDVTIDLIDRRNYHLFQPLLYQVAMAGLNPSEIAVPIRSLFSKRKNVNVILAHVDSVDTKNSTIKFDGKEKKYDYIIMACGAKHFYFGNDDWEKHAPGLKNLEQATEIRRRVLTAFEFASKIEDQKTRQEYLTFTVVGAGPTGVELAGAISEMASKTLKKDFHNLDTSNTEVVLVEAGDRVLTAFPEKLSKVAHKNLEKMGVKVKTNCLASNLTEDGLFLGDEFLPCKTILWAAGVKPSSVSATMDTNKDGAGHIIVKSDLSIDENKNIFVIGDQAATKDKDGKLLPGVAPVAIQQGNYVGKTIPKELKGQTRKEFRYFDKGIMATIGRSKAVVSAGRINISGFFAWLIWVFIHIAYLMQFKNKFFVFLQWIWSYFTFGRGARLIVQKSWRFFDGKKIDYR